MATPTTPGEEIRVGGTPSGEPVASNTPSDDRLGTASFVLAGIAVTGLLIVIFGVFLTPNDMAILIGASIVTLTGIGWTIVAAIMLVSTIKRWFNDSGKANTTAPPTRPEPR